MITALRRRRAASSHRRRHRATSVSRTRPPRASTGCSETKVRRPVESPALGMARDGEQRDARRAPAVDADVAEPILRPPPDRPRDLGGSAHLDAQPLLRGEARLRPCGPRAAAARRPRSGSTDAAICSPGVQRPARAGRARTRSRAGRASRRRARPRSALPSTAEISSTPSAPAGADQDVAGAERVAGLHPVRPGSRGAAACCGCRSAARGRRLRSSGAAGGGDPGEARDLEQPAAQRDQVGGAGVVARLVEADRVGVVGVGEAEGGGPQVHLADEPRLAAGGGRPRASRRRRCRCAGSAP